MKTEANDYVFLSDSRLHLLNLVERVGPVVITQCAVCHFFVKAPELTCC